MFAAYPGHFGNLKRFWWPSPLSGTALPLHVWLSRPPLPLITIMTITVMTVHGIIVTIIVTANAPGQIDRLVFGVRRVLLGEMVLLPSAGRHDEAVCDVDELTLTMRMMAVVIAMTMMEVIAIDFLMWRRRDVWLSAWRMSHR